MTQGPDFNEQPNDPTTPQSNPETPQPDPGAPPPPPPTPGYGAPAAGAPSYGTPAYGTPGQPGPGFDPNAPYGVHPMSGVPYSDKSKLIAGLLQILIPLGIGRMYIGDTKTGVIQLVVTLITCGIGALWPVIDGILMLVGEPNDALGRPLRS
ncbi:TM2 domain-containing protein [Nocardioides sp.]|uniref:TM2 domain-containing protein n=1 Tax=Nocardioides sp. TaxID=35761 RepID=UPI00273344D9|nr:TM2 domain-containing protein [Nocardioides sp.]MDP3891091.1 TM2 domain-containing protein [Nocardioides sp.]